MPIQMSIMVDAYSLNPRPNVRRIDVGLCVHSASRTINRMLEVNARNVHQVLGASSLWC